jgi:hypothetical protein
MFIKALQLDDDDNKITKTVMAVIIKADKKISSKTNRIIRGRKGTGWMLWNLKLAEIKIYTK